MAVFAVQAEETATLSFASTDQRVSQDSNSQVWSNAGITFTNNKASSTTNVANYSNPVRLYANSEVVVEIATGTITKIEFTCGSSSYATELKNSVGAEAVASSSVVTVTPTSASNSYTIASLTAQVRLKEITVTYVTSTGGDTPVTPTLSIPTITPADGTSFEESLEVTIAAEEGATIYYTTNGDEPSTTSDVYSVPFTITETTTVKAYAVKEGSNDSSVASATYTKKTVVAGNWNLVSAASELSAGDEVVIVATDYAFALSTTQNTNNRAQVEVQKDGNTVTFTDDVQVITLEEGNIDGTFAFNTGDGYLYAASSSSNHLKTEAAISDNSSWTIEIADGVAKIVAQGENSRNTMQYNQSSKLFACYSSASQKAVSIYKNFEEGEQPVAVPSAPVFSTPESATKFVESIEVSIAAENGMTFIIQQMVTTPPMQVMFIQHLLQLQRQQS